MLNDVIARLYVNLNIQVLILTSYLHYIFEGLHSPLGFVCSMSALKYVFVLAW
jgi:hypothetical protein